MGLSQTRTASNVAGAVEFIIEMNCDSGAAVGDLVRVSDTLDNFAVVASDNTDNRPVRGQIKEKISATLCKVILQGLVDTVLTTKGRVFLSPTGTFTTTQPTSDYIQELGYSFGNGKLLLDPTQTVIKVS